jgi:hypothetical protein
VREEEPILFVFDTNNPFALIFGLGLLGCFAFYLVESIINSFTHFSLFL